MVRATTAPRRGDFAVTMRGRSRSRRWRRTGRASGKATSSEDAPAGLDDADAALQEELLGAVQGRKVGGSAPSSRSRGSASWPPLTGSAAPPLKYPQEEPGRDSCAAAVSSPGRRGPPPALVDDGHAVADLLHHFQDVRGVDDAAPPAPPLRDQLLQDLLRRHVEAIQRLVEEEHPGVVLEGGDEQDLLLHPLRVLAQGAVEVPPRAKASARAARRASASAGGSAVEVPHQVEELPAGEDS